RGAPAGVGGAPPRPRCYDGAPGYRLVLAEYSGAYGQRGPGGCLWGDAGASATATQMAAVHGLGGGRRMPFRDRADADVEGFGVHLFSVLRPPPRTVGSRHRRRPC